ncbi:MAG: hypothetical protein FWE29_05155 [Defluviitaleaceae bacterium]|nr:hypothetical protein [Defluviitaleaceae bacterium]
MAKKILRFAHLLVILTPLLLSACWDKVELEERAYVISIGIDKYEANEKKDEDKKDSGKDKKSDEKKGTNELDSEKDHDNIFLVSMSLPDLSSTGKDSGNEDVKSAVGKTIHSAIGSTDGFSGKKLYFGHTKLIVINEEILKDEKLLRETLDAFERNDQVSGRAIVLSSESKAEKILETNPPSESMVGMFVSSFYRSGHNTAGASFKQDLTGIVRELRAKGSTIIPKIELKGKELEIGGGALISETKLNRWLTEDEMRGYLWSKKGKASGTVIEIEKDGTFLPLKVSKHKSNTFFSKTGDTIICQTDIKIDGVLESFIFGENPPDLKNLAKKYESVILSEIANADENINLLEFEFLDEMKKTSSHLYNDYINGEKDIEVAWNVDVRIVRTGNLINSKSIRPVR